VYPRPYLGLSTTAYELTSENLDQVKKMRIFITLTTLSTALLHVLISCIFVTFSVADSALFIEAKREEKLNLAKCF
jgi:hypothetical protein